MRVSIILAAVLAVVIAGVALDAWHRQTATPRLSAVCRGVTSDDAEAARLRAAADKGDPAAEYEVGRFYLFGRDAAPDLKQALGYLQRAADKGNMDAQFELGRLYGYEDLKKDEGRAREYYRAAMLQGHQAAAIGYVGLLHMSQDMDEAAYRQREKESQDQALLGLLREHGLADEIKGPPDAALFARLLQRGEAGDGAALYLSGLMLDMGYGITADEARATLQYNEAAALGNPAALTLLGSRMRQQGDEAGALQYFEAAAAKGDAGAYFLRGLLHRNRAAPDYAAAYADFRRAADLGSTDALTMLFRAHMRGEGVPADDRQAYIWALRAMQSRDNVMSVGIWSDCEAIAWDLGPAARREAEAEARNWHPAAR